MTFSWGTVMSLTPSSGPEPVGWAGGSVVTLTQRLTLLRKGLPLWEESRITLALGKLRISSHEKKWGFQN